LVRDASTARIEVDPMSSPMGATAATTGSFH
jgi:hypothetical protein